MTNHSKTRTLFLLAWASLLQIRAGAGELVVGRIDDFEDGTEQGWSGGGSQENIFGGGPEGEDDRYLEIRRPTPEEPYPFHVGTKNTTTWTGDYLSSGVRAIQMDVKTFAVGFGPENLALRIVLFGPGGAFSSRKPTTIITEDGWQRIEFGLTRSDLLRVFAGGPYQDPGPETDDLTATLRNVDVLLIRHDPGLIPSSPGSHPEHIEATLGIDNITAVTGPAPTYDAALTFGNASNQAYSLDHFEPDDVALGDLGTEEPALLLHLGRRYQVTVLDPVGHPFELIAKSDDPEKDDVLLSAAEGVAAPFEGTSDVAWFDNGSGTVTFTLTDGLFSAMTTPGWRPGYRCGLHPLTMRGDISVCTAPIAGDLNGDCRVDLDDLVILMDDWLEGRIVP